MVPSELPFSIDKDAYIPAKPGMELIANEAIADKRVAQLIDANLDRAREGLRVVEDWCRFGLKNEDFLFQIKCWRQELGKLHLKAYKEARSTSSDYGIGIKHTSQGSRETPIQIVEANCGRVQEALRVLEEFGRTSHPNLSQMAAKIRYDLYELEINILKKTTYKQRKEKLRECNLCLITSPKENLHIIVSKALEAGIKMVQYRCKENNDSIKLSQAHELALICKDHKALFIIKHRIDIALAVDADGVHLGQKDLPSHIARKLLGEEYLIGRSTHNLKELEKAQEDLCDYIGVGPVYNTKTKPELKKAGIGYIKEVSQHANLPWFAIGGINHENVQEVIASGAKRIAVVDAIMNSTDPAQATKILLRTLK